MRDGDQVIEILRLAIKTRGIELLGSWLDCPRAGGGLTPAEHMKAGNYDRARLLAVTTHPGESERIQINRGQVPWQQRATVGDGEGE